MWVSCHQPHDKDFRQLPYGVKAGPNRNDRLAMDIIGDGDVSFYGTHAELVVLLDRARAAIDAAEARRLAEVAK